MNDNTNKISRRDFLKGSAAAVVGAAVVGTGCKSTSSSVSATKTEEKATKGKMNYRVDPVSCREVSTLGYGCMRFQTIAEEDGRQRVDQESVDELVAYAIEHGVNLFDTSPRYLQSQSEAAVGKALSRFPRESYLLSTKLSNFSDSSYEASLKMYRDSFVNLQTEYIDYYLLHNIGSIKAFNERFVDNGMLDFLMEERRMGRIRHLGYSIHANQETFDHVLSLYDKYHWDFALIQLNYVDWKNANPSAEYMYSQLEARGMMVFIMEPLLGGRLANVPDAVASKLLDRDPAASVASWAFRFAASHRNVLTVLSGMTYMEHLRDNIKTFSPLVELSDEEKDFMIETGRLLNAYPTIPCNDCKYCMPCPYGIDIAGIFTHYNKCVNEGWITLGKDEDGYRRARRKYLLSYARAIEPDRQAEHCISCGKCAGKCPQRIRIPAELRKISKYIEDVLGGDKI